MTTTVLRVEIDELGNSHFFLQGKKICTGTRATGVAHLITKVCLAADHDRQALLEAEDPLKFLDEYQPFPKPKAKREWTLEDLGLA